MTASSSAGLKTELPRTSKRSTLMRKSSGKSGVGMGAGEVGLGSGSGAGRGLGSGVGRGADEGGIGLGRSPPGRVGVWASVWFPFGFNARKGEGSIAVDKVVVDDKVGEDK